MTRWGKKIIIFIFSIVGCILFTICVKKSLISFEEKEIDGITEIYSTEEFADAIANGSGDYLIYGDMVVENAVTSDEIEGEYIYLEKETLTKVGTDTKKVSIIIASRTVTSYKWETTNTETQTCDSIVFLGVELPMSFFISQESSTLISTIKATDDTHQFYGIEAEAASFGTLYVTIEDGSIVDIADFYSDTEIADVKAVLKTDATDTISSVSVAMGFLLSTIVGAWEAVFAIEFSRREN